MMEFMLKVIFTKIVSKVVIKKIVIILLMIIIDNYYWWLLLMMMVIIMVIICYCNKTKFSSSINEVIRPVLNFLFFFYDKISQVQKSIKKNTRHNQYIRTLWFLFRIRFYIKCRLKVNLVLFIYMYFYLKATVKKIYHDGFNN